MPNGSRRRGALFGVTGTASAVAVVVLLTGCGAGQPPQAAGHPNHQGQHGMRMTMPGMDMSGGAMSGMDMAAMRHRPSSAAKMICTAETRRHVGHILELSAAPDGTPSWKAPNYECSYRLGTAGELVLTVNDASQSAAGAKFFGSVQQQLAPTQRLKGLQALGLPSFETSTGDVVFLKDGKTLTVDASGLQPSALPAGQSRTDVAYAVAADIVACWSD